MRMSEGVEWAVHACTVLAGLPEGAALPAARLAEYHGVPAPYLAKHLQSLSAAGVLETTRGRRGGYRLARPAAEVTVLDIVLAVEGEDPAFACSEIRQRGPIGAPPEACRTPCTIARTMWDAEQAWRDSLATVTLADIVADVAAKLVAALPAETLVDLAVKAGDWFGEAAR